MKYQFIGLIVLFIAFFTRTGLADEEIPKETAKPLDREPRYLAKVINLILKAVMSAGKIYKMEALKKRLRSTQGSNESAAQTDEEDPYQKFIDFQNAVHSPMGVDQNITREVDALLDGALYGGTAEVTWNNESQHRTMFQELSSEKFDEDILEDLNYQLRCRLRLPQNESETWIGFGDGIHRYVDKLVHDFVNSHPKLTVNNAKWTKLHSINKHLRKRTEDEARKQCDFSTIGAHFPDEWNSCLQQWRNLLEDFYKQMLCRYRLQFSPIRENVTVPWSCDIEKCDYKWEPYAGGDYGYGLSSDEYLGRWKPLDAILGSGSLLFGRYRPGSRKVVDDNLHLKNLDVDPSSLERDVGDDDYTKFLKERNLYGTSYGSYNI